MSDFTGAGVMFTLFVGIVLGLLVVSAANGKYSTFRLLFRFSFLAVFVLFASLVSNRLLLTSIAYFYYLLVVYISYFVTVIWTNALLLSKKSQGKKKKKR